MEAKVAEYLVEPEKASFRKTKNNTIKNEISTKKLLILGIFPECRAWFRFVSLYAFYIAIKMTHEPKK